MALSRCRVELRGENKSHDDAFRSMLSVFRKKVNEYGILAQWKECQYFESKGQKRRRRQRELELERIKDKNRLKTKLRENFFNKGFE